MNTRVIFVAFVLMAGYTGNHDHAAPAAETPSSVAAAADNAVDKGGRAPGSVPLRVVSAHNWYVGPARPGPKNIENLETRDEARKRKECQVYVPIGTRNVALGKHIDCSDECPVIGELCMLSDGEKGDSRRGIDRAMVELDPGMQWVQIDLGEKCAVYAVAVWHYIAGENKRVYRDVVVQIGDDANMGGKATTVFNNDHDNSSKFGIGTDKLYLEDSGGRVMDAKGVRGRYVRLYSNGNTDNDMNHYYEVEVYGKPL